MKIRTLRNFIRPKIVITVVIALVLIVGGYFLFFKKSPVYKFVTVERGSVTETVSLTGNTKPAQSVSLAFGSTGIISNIYSDLGKEVRAGQVLAELNMSDLMAQLKNARAALTIVEQQATSSKRSLDDITAEQNVLVANAYRTLLNSYIAALSISNRDAYDSPTVTGTYECEKEGVYNIETYASAGGVSVRYSGLEGQDTFLLTDVPRPLGNCGLFLSFDMTKNLYAGMKFAIEIPNKSASNYNLNQNAYKLALKTRDRVIADAQANIGVDNTSVTDARLAQASASVDSVMAKIKDARIIAPISGIVTQFDAKKGQLASPSSALVSIISSDGYEVEAGLSETDVGKVQVGNKVTMTLDALQGETFTGTVFYIAPAQTNVEGVISYQIKISFDKPDARFKSGFTANIDIETRRKDNILVLPQYAILQNDEGTFVEVLKDGVVKRNSIKLGISDQDGNVEIVSGVTEGEQVLNIGLKK